MYYNKIEFKKVEINEFIKNHKHINYCEAIIYQDGYITYASPSHQQSLIRITGLEVDELQKLVPITADTIGWLLDYTKCISVWFDGYMLPTGEELYYRNEEENCIFLTQEEKKERYDYKPTKEQLNSLKLLIDNKIICDCRLR